MLAGGFAAYILGRTSDYGDVDLFSEDAHLESALLADGRYVRNRRGQYGEYTGYCSNKQRMRCVLNHKVLNLQIVLIHNTTPWRGAQFYYELLKSFDMQVCRVGLFLHNAATVAESLSYMCINKYIGTIKQSSRRQERYRRRMLHHGPPPTLQELCQFQVQVSDPAYKTFSLDEAYYCVADCEEVE
ncbi:unknown [Orgyia pseudotsugata multiple nucleopolyhedrovirus]|uniref:Uncharacterized protein n=1 Tax=Orgyia pseudotsugata multicapsid polyhedrosis virus TaxID=262177 RepID=O10342_NPVOP|nr:hypothetical protein OpmnVgp098 [Orgyia pseudotsugata multiple nucleopolyhedrovirus]AAC59097.1 unknown [Orgyia pseudotsugata multiple nucleopolyhedrovirus]